MPRTRCERHSCSACNGHGYSQVVIPRRPTADDESVAAKYGFPAALGMTSLFDFSAFAGGNRLISLRSPLVFVFLLSFAAACSPSAPGQAGGSSSQSQPSGPKTLTIGILREPATIDGFTGEGGSRGGAGD